MHMGSVVVAAKRFKGAHGALWQNIICCTGEMLNRTQISDPGDTSCFE